MPTFDGIDLLHQREEALRKIRGARIGMVFQEPMTALNPLLRIGGRSQEVLRGAHDARSPRACASATIEVLDDVGIPEPARPRPLAYPHQLSGGMRQRAMIATALACRPQLLIADEPTTALDVTLQAQILRLLGSSTATRMSVLLVTHDLGVVAETCDDVVVMYAGEVVETGRSPTLRPPAAPLHPPAARGASAGRCVGDAPHPDPGRVPPATVERSGCAFRNRCDAATVGVRGAPVAGRLVRSVASALLPRRRARRSPPVSVDTTVSTASAVRPAGGGGLEIRDLRVTYRSAGAPPVTAVAGVSMSVPAGVAQALIGESGSGKSTLGRAVANLVPVESGSITLDGGHLEHLRGAALRRHRGQVQVIFQDPHSALDPRKSVLWSVMEPLRVAGASRADARRDALAALDRVGITAELAERYPHQLSGGQKQRINIARALIRRPKVLICDEPVAALDVSLQAEIINLLVDLQREDGITLLFITHDVSLLPHFADRLAVMYLAELVETGPARGSSSGRRTRTRSGCSPPRHASS